MIFLIKKSMEFIVKDNFYTGKEIVIEDVLGDILQSKALRRLHGLYQNDISGFLHNFETSRFQHSCGTMILVRLLGGTIDEQISALICDIFHSNFSAAINSMFGGTINDQVKKMWCMADNDIVQELIEILGPDYEFYFNDSAIVNGNCASANGLDTILHDSITLGLVSKDYIQKIVNKLVIRNVCGERQICATDEETAKKIRKLSKKNIEIYDNSEWRIMENQQMAGILDKLFCERKLNISGLYFSDFSDKEMLKKLQIKNEKTFWEYKANKIDLYLPKCNVINPYIAD